MDFKDLLKQHLEERKVRNTHYSLRAMARDLECNAGFLSRILAGKVSTSEKQTKRMCELLGIDEDTTEAVISFQKLKSRQREFRSFTPLQEDLFNQASSSIPFVILELFNLKDFVVSVDTVASFLGISEQEAVEHLHCLERLSVVEVLPDQTYSIKSSHNSTVHTQAPHEALYLLQKEFLEKAIIALKECPFEKRSQNTLTFAFRKKELDQVNKIIYRCIREINELSIGAAGDCDEVYNLTVALVPSSQT